MVVYPNHIYFPNDLLSIPRKKANDRIFFIGFEEGNSYIIITFLSEETLKKLIKNNFLKEDLVFNWDNLSGLKVIATFNFEYKELVQFVFNKNMPIIHKSQSNYNIILFNAPNFKNLEYYSIKPILLQISTESNSNEYVKKINYQGPIKRSYDNIHLHISLDKINQCLKTRELFHSHEYLKLTETSNRKSHLISQLKSLSLVKYLQNKTIMIFIFFSMWVQYVIQIMLELLNFKYFNHLPSLKVSSVVLRQLDLRLQQINYFPIQFLNYYDPSKLSYTNKLKLKENVKLNVNNSNYINLHNSLWLIINDILIGIAIQKLILRYTANIESFINNYLIQKLLFTDLQNLTLWLMDYPAGLKLNKELAEFIGELFLWTLKFWKIIFSLSQDASFTIFCIRSFSYLGLLGVSFIICFIIDYLRLITFHIYAFYYTSARIYKRQISIIKSLFQLFCGKKYNVLRNRIDSSTFEIDQLLLGTLLFMVLIYLLPTMAAFYLNFVVTRLIILIFLRFLESVLMMVNFFPLFVLLLKFKNSNRLQGGINLNLVEIVSIPGRNQVNVLKLTNKSLSYRMIFKNFVQLFKNFKIFKVEIISHILLGDIIILKQNYGLNSLYLMLPQNFRDTKELWDCVK